MKRVLAALLAIVTAVAGFGSAAYAYDFDGDGKDAGSGEIEATDNFKMGPTAEGNLSGYRFTVYKVTGDNEGKTVGHPIDVLTRGWKSGNVERANGKGKTLSDGLEYDGMDEDAFRSRLTATDPSEDIAEWIYENEERILDYCGAEEVTDHYITVEPMFKATADGTDIIGTLRDFAKMQGSYYGMNRYPKNGEQGTYGFIAVNLGYRYLGMLYTKNTYHFDGVEINGVPGSCVREDGIKLGSSGCFNTANDIFGYGVGIGVFRNSL